MNSCREFEGKNVEKAVELACNDEDAQATWQLYHMVGDVLRSGELARRDTGADFAAGVLSFSPEGASHFADVRRLFLLDLRVLAVCVTVLLVLYALRRKKGLTLSPLAGHSPGFWAGCGLGGALAIAGVLAALDFDRAFTVFHIIFFPGKDNWLFDPATDPVILILPEAFFRSCAILILAAVLLCCAALIIADLCRRRRAS